MELPKEITVGNRKYAVVVKQISRNILGTVRYDCRVITVHTMGRNKRQLQPADMRETFWHELTHAILHDMGDPRYKDEVFVTAFSSRLSKAIDSARFE